MAVVTLKYSAYLSSLGFNHEWWKYARKELFLKIVDCWIGFRGYAETLFDPPIWIRIAEIDEEKESISFFVDQRSEDYLVTFTKNEGRGIELLKEEEGCFFERIRTEKKERRSK